MKHTPGPWQVNHFDHCQVCDSDGISRGCSAIAQTFGPGKTANARLIAAAPDLLFHLLAASNYIDALGGDSKSYRAAIAKATAA